MTVLDWITAFSTLGTAAVAFVVLGMQLQERKDLRTQRREEQARSVVAWISKDMDGHGEVSIRNVSRQPVTDVTIKIPRGLAGQIIADVVPVVPPDEIITRMATIRDGQFVGPAPVPIIEFQDAAGRWWRRQAGSLEEIPPPPAPPTSLRSTA